MRLKHNKKRNTAFIYEALVRELTKNVIKQNKYRIKEVTRIIKEAFRRGTFLQKELSIYRPLYEGPQLSKEMANRLLLESKSAYDKLDKTKIFKEQSMLISQINKRLSSNIFKTFVPNYKNIATVHSIFNADLPPREKIVLEEKITQCLSASSESEDLSLEHIDNIVYKTFVDKFNKKYSTTLSENQKRLLSKYISSFSDNGLELKVYLNEELGRIKKTIKDSYNVSEISEDPDLTSKMSLVENMLDSLREIQVGDTLIRKVIKIQNLVEEIKNGTEDSDRA